MYFREKYLFFLLFLLLKGIRFASSFESSTLPLSCLTPHDSRERVHILHLLLLLAEEDEDDQNLSKSSSSSSVSSSRKGAWRNFLLEFVSLKRSAREAFKSLDEEEEEEEEEEESEGKKQRLSLFYALLLLFLLLSFIFFCRLINDDMNEVCVLLNDDINIL